MPDRLGNSLDGAGVRGRIVRAQDPHHPRADHHWDDDDIAALASEGGAKEVIGCGLAIGPVKGAPAVEDLIEDRWVARGHPKAADARTRHVFARAVPAAKHTFAKRQERGASGGREARLTRDTHNIIARGDAAELSEVRIDGGVGHLRRLHRVSARGGGR